MARSLENYAMPVVQPVPVVSEADCLQAFRNVRQRQAKLAPAKLVALHDRLLGPKGIFVLLGRELEQLGRQAPLLEDVTALDSIERRTLAERAVVCALAYHNRRTATLNPYREASRERLCWMVYDKHAPFALVERYVALLALHQRDGVFFARLIETTRGCVERRILFSGLLEHHDALLPVERSVYPADYRAAQQRHLDHEESIYGPLDLDQPIWKLLETLGSKKLLRRVAAQLARRQALLQTATDR
ncbi:hypothetical protein IFR09_05920 [Pseudomonas syringae]|nr:hypothetical protein [Pseudomonas syringae]MBD8574704.1 hypothetical protein [Pseudomonas syringae]MBD8789267.1 hypothetical protein [Pseudomonas syringae]MBD8800289.1 hypothetical protein [Pseudomonas syringae]MBD8810695.1 hypothetical protein [Pseudomonas syringae]